MPSKKQILIRNVPEQLSDWIAATTRDKNMSQQKLLISVLDSARTTPNKIRLKKPRKFKGGASFSFIDLFAGIGGFRIALEQLGGVCRFTSEWDKYSQATYRAWFGDQPHGDIRTIDPADIPDHDILVAGFPCQPFSIAGVSKKNSLGRLHGFQDEKQGNLFFHIAEIVRVKRPPVLLLENVKNLKSHDKGNTWKVIQGTLDALGYEVRHEIIDAAAWVPQHRERIFIVAFDRNVFGEKPDFKFPKRPETKRILSEILDSKTNKKYVLSEHLWDYLQKYAMKHKAKGNGFGYGMPRSDGVTRTLSARYHKDGSEILIKRRSGPPRRLTPSECARLMGFPDSLPIVVSDTQAYRQFGNAVVVPVIKAVGSEVVKTLLSIRK